MAKGKGRRKPEVSARYKSNLAKKKANKVRKEQDTKEYWANNEEYLKKQAEKGYKKINGKWIKTKKVENVNNK